LKVRLQLLLGCCTLLALSIGVSWIHFYYRTADHNAEKRFTFRVNKGENVSDIASRLEDRKLITWSVYFTVLARFKDADRAIKAGTFELPGSATPPQIIAIISKSRPGVERLYTFPEGLNRWQVADLMSEYGWSRTEVLRIITERTWEGRLFPDSYRLGPKESALDVLTRMNKRFEKIWAKLRSDHPKKSELSEHELLTLASIVEKETVDKDEASVIAQVFFNRLGKKMKLQSDPTYVYTPDRYGQKPTKADRLRKGNVYNTDQIKGLPPGPIANPGRNAMLAVLKPSTDPKAKAWLFFVAKRDGTGRHHFSKTYDEHKKAVRKFLMRKK